ncbi:hypothetical protein [Pseudomonas palmensis]|uniref:hypothetical protein n=1 Tax=Pseudomonas palmensis TaxID=2815362 RepID=UPI001AE90082|nr:hypothetical protein [Pseudomonas palmensis]
MTIDKATLFFCLLSLTASNVNAADGAHAAIRFQDRIKKTIQHASAPKDSFKTTATESIALAPAVFGQASPPAKLQDTRETKELFK